MTEQVLIETLWSILIQHKDTDLIYSIEMCNIPPLQKTSHYTFLNALTRTSGTIFHFHPNKKPII